ncbi:MAG: TlyA family RNA methyltransferase [Deltaproteobacteria bacterium]|nr:TlyA family RNA methyltransferase [Deltaproteobacteria bacterium]
MSKIKKERIDKLLLERGFAESREKAKALIMAGRIVVNDKRADKAGEVVPFDAEIRIKGEAMPYVSRGGLKLQEAINHFNIDVKGLVALDIGASTGGFTDCLLQHDVERVYAIDVGYGQMDLKVKNDRRVISMERKNIRHMVQEDIPEKADIAVMDLSFISLAKVIPHVIPLLKEDSRIVALIKPQFEVGKGEVGKGGIVRDEAKIDKVIREISDFMADSGLNVIGITPSPILGAKGNREFLIYMLKKS